ncbi:MAG TPA: hypothetical protein VLE47_03985, partial [Candidatus Saccharimonadales bacterium]|nr:hypothetical protein [Candidatus Saccharimonadales bacterium]
MTIRDVDQWVSKVIEDITRFRPHLGKEERGVQVSILKKLGTQGISYAERDELTIARKRGKLHEELTKLDPSYIKTQGQAGAARDYMLAFLRTTSFEIPLVPPRSFSNPDDLIIDEGSTATIVGIVEIKHTAPNKDLIRQLGYILEDIDLIVQLLRRNFRNIQRTVGHKPSFPEINGQSWPKGIKNLVLKSDYRRILYLPADRDAYVEGWEVRNSSFTDNEIKRIVQIGWDDLVAKGGATTSAEEEPAMAIHRPNEAGARSRLRDAIGVPSARPTEEDVTTQQSLTEKRPNMCSWCHELPYYFGPNVNGVQVPYGYRVFNKRTQEYEFVNLCLIDMGRYNANLSEEMKAKSHATVAETLQHFPGKLNGEFMDQQIDRKVQEIIDGVGTDPDQLLIAA